MHCVTNILTVPCVLYVNKLFILSKKLIFRKTMDVKKKAYYNCSVNYCKNTTVNSNYEFYSFPTNNPLFPFKVVRRQAWLDALKKKE